MEDHHLLALLLLLLRGPPSREIGEDYHLTVDRLALTFSVLDEDALLQLLHREASRVGSSKLYKHVFHRGRLGDGVHRLQIDHGFLGDRGRTSRIDFIRGDSLTAAALQEDGAFLSDLAKFAVRTSWRVSRVDVAVDAPFSIHHIQALDSSEQKALRWIGSRGVETISLGGRRSEHEIELYDKRQQLMDRGRADESHPQQTRIEARRKNVGGSLCELPSLRNPFTSLVLLCLGFDGPLVDALLAGWSAFVGVAGVEAAVRNGVVTASSFDKFKARAASRARKLRVVHPAAVFDSNWDQLSNDLVRRLSVLGIGGVR